MARGVVRVIALHDRVARKFPVGDGSGVVLFSFRPMGQLFLDGVAGAAARREREFAFEERADGGGAVRGLDDACRVCVGGVVVVVVFLGIPLGFEPFEKKGLGLLGIRGVAVQMRAADLGRRHGRRGRRLRADAQGNQGNRPGERASTSKSEG